MNSVPKLKIKKKKKSLADRKADKYSKFWLNKCDRLIGEIWHDFYSTGVCCINNSDCKYWHSKPEMHHMISKEHYLYRWDIDNMLDLCHYHHDRFSKLSPHSTPELFLAWLANNHPVKWEYIKNNKGTITRKKELPFTFEKKYYELLELKEKFEFQSNLKIS